MIGFIIGNIRQHFFNNLHHKVIYLQLTASAGKYQLYNMKVQELGFSTGFYKRGMPVVIGEEWNTPIMLQQLIEKTGLEFKDGAFIRNGMGMGYSAFITRF